MYATSPLRSLSSPLSPLPPITTKSTPPLASSFDRVAVSNSNFPLFNLALDFKPNWAIRASSLSSSSLTRSNYVEEEESLESSSSSSSPVSVELEQILNESHFDRLLADAQQHHDSLVILWMASWCRKCIYLKPKLKKLAAEYYPRIRFYCIDVNNVPHKLVVRAGVTKMPTIQVWKDSKKQAEMIGGHKAYLVVNEVREMIENEDPNV